MSDYIYSNPWREAAGFGDSLASGIAHLAIQLPQLRMQQQQIAAHTALLNAQREYEQQRTSTLLPQEVAYQQARTGTELAQGGYYKAGAEHLGAQTSLENEKVAALKADAANAHEAGVSFGNFTSAFLRNDPGLPQYAEDAVAKFFPYAQSHPHEAVPAVQKVLSMVEAQGKDPQAFLSFLTGNAGAMRPLSVPTENRLIAPSGQEVAPALGRELSPGGSFNYFPTQQQVTSPSIPMPFGPSMLGVSGPAMVAREPMVSPVEQRQSTPASPWNFLTEMGRQGELSPEQTQGLIGNALTLVPKGTNAISIATPPPPTGAPKVGEIRKGYKFLGGDPANQKSWQKIP